MNVSQLGAQFRNFQKQHSGRLAMAPCTHQRNAPD